MTDSPTDAMTRTSLTVRIPEKPRDGEQQETFQFRIPTFHDEIKIGVGIKDLRRKLEPNWDGFEQGLDGSTMYLLRAAATFETLLEKSSAKWPFTANDTGNVLVDSAKFPPDRVMTVQLAYQGYVAALDRFRAGGNPDEDNAGSKDLAAQQSAGE